MGLHRRVVAIAGVVMVVLNGTLSFHLSPLGDLLALAAAAIVYLAGQFLSMREVEPIYQAPE